MDLIVTRHPALVKYLIETGVCKEGVEVAEHATHELLKGKHVAGVLPLDLASVCASVTIIPLKLTPELRGVELSIEQVRSIAGSPRTFSVKEI